jgi:type II secretory pathway component GspD/PulD (secretin)
MHSNAKVAMVIVRALTLIGATHDTCFAAAHSETPGDSNKKISLDLQNASIDEVLRLIAAASGLNMITSPEVSGTIPTHMTDVPWDQALDAILHRHGLAQERYGNVVLIVPLGQFMAQHQARKPVRPPASESIGYLPEKCHMNATEEPWRLREARLLGPTGGEARWNGALGRGATTSCFLLSCPPYVA